MKLLLSLLLILAFLFPCCIESDEYTFAREKMVSRQIVSRGVSDKLVLAAMRKVPRHEFVPGRFKVTEQTLASLKSEGVSDDTLEKLANTRYSRFTEEGDFINRLRRDIGEAQTDKLKPLILKHAEKASLYAYEDNPQPIGEEQTISQPYIVALMTELLELKGGEKVLEIGTGSGYQAAILAEIAKEVYTIEIVESLARTAEERLKGMKYENITVKCGDGYQGWKEHAPFDGVIVTAAPDHIPQPLVDQLKVGGRMVIPVGSYYQELKLLTKTEDGVKEKNIIPVRFVPMTGEAQQKK